MKELNLNTFAAKCRIETSGLDSIIRDRIEQIERSKNGKNLPLPFMVSLTCEELDITGWLSAQNKTPKIYWSDRNGDQEIGAVGTVLTISETEPALFESRLAYIEAILNESPDEQLLRFFGGANFNSQITHEQDWSGYQTFWFILPEMIIERIDQNYRISVTLLMQPGMSVREIKEQIIAKIEALQPVGFEPESMENNRIVSRIDQPDEIGWQKNIDSALRLITGDKLKKVVLSRKTTLSFSHRVNSKIVLEKLKRRNHSCFTFLFQPESGSVFLGATPERIFRIDRNVLISEAVSGTSARMEKKEEDFESGKNLLESDKDLREHHFVAEDIKNKFELLCQDSSLQPKPVLLKLANVQHLYTKIVGHLRKKTSVYEIIKALHPTPAVGGTPRREAVRTIQDLEPFERGWFAGPVGYLSKDFSEIAVALRSMLIHENQVHLFAGAGIVEGSEPESEWQELENKISLALDILEG